MSLQFHTLPVRSVAPETADAAVVTLAVPDALRQVFAFQPGQFLTLRARIDGQELRRSYSLCSTPARLAEHGELQVGIKAVDGGAFSTWAVRALRAGDTLDVLPPEGRFTPRAPVPADRPLHRVGFAAGSGITPLLSIIDSTLAADPQARFTLVYGNRTLASVMFHERLQDLKDRHPARLSLVHVLSRQAQEIALFNGHIDAAKVRALLDGLLAPEDIAEAFVCGPEGMIDAAEHALRAAGLPRERIHAERFVAPGASPAPATAQRTATAPAADVALAIVLDGKTHQLGMAAGGLVLDTALAAGLDLPYSCKGGVCCTCRARVLEGEVRMDRNYTLEDWELAKGFVLTCQARPLTPRVVVSYDER